MFPVGDFNFVVAGIATFAATVGYACTRRLSTGLSAPSAENVREELVNEAELAENSSVAQEFEQTSVDSEMTTYQSPAITENESNNTPASIPTPARKETLKRKIPHDGFDEPEKQQELGYPHNLANIYPHKRSRTPSTESPGSEATTPNITPAASLDSILSQTSDVDVEIPLVSQDPESIVATPAPEPPRTPSPVPEQASPSAPSPTPAPPSPVFAFAPQPASARPATSNFLNSRPMTPKPFASPSGGFAAFAGSASPFASVSKSPQSTFPSSSKRARSIWSTGDLTTHQNDEISEEDKLGGLFKAPSASSTSKQNHALEEAKVLASPPAAKFTHVTGEEDEDVELELKGLKLFTKRGNKPFADGIVGHIKLLSNRTTLEERILFRREPLWKVSMNIRVQPTVRCTLVPEENVLRIILQEAIESASGETSQDLETKQEVVIYALKPGRSCSKQDFKDFAEALVKSPHFKTASTASSP